MLAYDHTVHAHTCSHMLTPVSHMIAHVRNEELNDDFDDINSQHILRQDEELES